MYRGMYMYLHMYVYMHIRMSHPNSTAEEIHIFIGMVFLVADPSAVIT